MNIISSPFLKWSGSPENIIFFIIYLFSFAGNIYFFTDNLDNYRYLCEWKRCPHSDKTKNCDFMFLNWLKTNKIRNNNNFFFFWGGKGSTTFSIFNFSVIFPGTISLWRVVVPSHKIVINLPRTFEKLPCKG